jgi:hypothetical protein
MNPRTLRQLGVALAVLVVVWLGLSALGRTRRDTAGRMTMSRFDPKTVDAAEIAHGADTLRFTRRATGWEVNGWRADRSLVQSLVGYLADTSAVTELVAQNALAHEELGLDSAHAWRVSALQGGHTVADLFVGNGGAYGSVYVRKPGQQAAYQLSSGLADLVTKPLSGWRDRTIADVPPDSVVEVDVRRGRKSYTVTRAKGGWRLDSGAADSAAVSRLLGAAHPLYGDGFPTAAQTDSLRRARLVRTVRLLGTAQRPLLVLSVDSVGPNSLWARREGDSTVYQLLDFKVQDLMPADSTLRPKPAAKAKRAK